jgi:hypothetical protein
MYSKGYLSTLVHDVYDISVFHYHERETAGPALGFLLEQYVIIPRGAGNAYVDGLAHRAAVALA